MSTRDRSASYWVAVNMRSIRKARGMSQEDLGAKIGWGKSTVATAENSHNGRRARKFGIDEVVRIAGALGATFDDLIRPVPPCATCGDEPPAGFTCNECGKAAA